MRRNSKALAFMLALALVIATPAAAFAEPQPSEGTIGGDSEVLDVVLNVELPSNLNFSLDPLGLDSEGNQMSSVDYFFINLTLAPVKVAIDIDATLAEGVTLVDDEEALSPDDLTVTEKELYFAALGATGLIEGSNIGIDVTPGEGDEPDTVEITGLEAAEGVYDFAAGHGTRVPFDAADKSAVIEFAIDKAVASTEEGADPDTLASLAPDDKGVAAFRFFGVLNTYAEWADGDVSVTGNYTLTPLRTTTYANVDFVAEGLNQIVPPVPEPEPIVYETAGFIFGEEGETVQDLEAAIANSNASGDPLEIPFYFDELTVTSLKLGATTYVANTDYKVEGDKLVILKAGTSQFKTLPLGELTFKLTLSDTLAYQFKLNTTN